MDREIFLRVKVERVILWIARQRGTWIMCWFPCQSDQTLMRAFLCSFECGFHCHSKWPVQLHHFPKWSYLTIEYLSLQREVGLTWSHRKTNQKTHEFPYLEFRLKLTKMNCINHRCFFRLFSIERELTPSTSSRSLHRVGLS